MSAPVEYPSLKEAADAASDSAQAAFLKLNLAQLSLLVITALISGWTPSSHEAQRAVAVAIACTMFLALAVVTVLRLTKFDDRWFRCRALAENVKSAVWYFVMSPASSAISGEGAYLAEIEEMRKRLEQVTKDVALRDSGGPLITIWMKQTRELSLDQKLSLYREKRLDDQRTWYLRHSQLNTKREKRWFGAILAVEFTALAYAVLQIWQLLEFNAIGAMAALSAAFIAWTQTKRFSDLALSYGIAAGDLARIAAGKESAATEPELQSLVKEVETAVSREHSIWLARRVC
jgi:hypothetical protein